MIVRDHKLDMNKNRQRMDGLAARSILWEMKPLGVGWRDASDRIATFETHKKAHIP